MVSAAFLENTTLDARNVDLDSLFVITEQGTGKKVPISLYPQKSRAAVGVPTTELSQDDHMLTTLPVNEEDTLLLIWTSGTGEQVQVLKVSNLQAFPRVRKGVQLVEGRILQVVKL